MLILQNSRIVHYDCALSFVERFIEMITIVNFLKVYVVFALDFTHYSH